MCQEPPILQEPHPSLGLGKLLDQMQGQLLILLLKVYPHIDLYAHEPEGWHILRGVALLLHVGLLVRLVQVDGYAVLAAAGYRETEEYARGAVQQVDLPDRFARAGA